jgi:hypothetical protein
MYIMMLIINAAIIIICGIETARSNITPVDGAASSSSPLDPPPRPIP